MQNCNAKHEKHVLFSSIKPCCNRSRQKNETENAHGKDKTLDRYTARTDERQTPGEIVGRLISLLFMVLGTCPLLQSIETCIPSKTGCFIGRFLYAETNPTTGRMHKNMLQFNIDIYTEVSCDAQYQKGQG